MNIHFYTPPDYNCNTYSASTPVALVPVTQPADGSQTRVKTLSGLVGERVRALRRERGLRQSDLAERVGLSEEWIRRIERGVGAPSLEVLGQLAEELDTPVASLVEEGTSQHDRLRILTRIAADLPDAQLRWLEGAARLARDLDRSTETLVPPKDD